MDYQKKSIAKIRIVILVILVSVIIGFFINYDRQLNHRAELELADLTNLFDGENKYKIKYLRHHNSDIAHVIGGLRGTGMSLPVEKATLFLNTHFFELKRNGPINLSESQSREFKTFVLASLCRSLMLNAFDSSDSVIQVNVKAVSNEFSGQVLNIRAAQDRCEPK